MDSLIWLLLNLATLILLAFFSMAEMAIISANPIRLEFLASQNVASAKQLLSLLKMPSRLFATTLIGVNIFMMSGSEFAREFHTSLGINPEWAPLSQIFIVILFGELVPQFAARRFSDTIALFSAPLIYGASKLLAPFVVILEWITLGINALFGTKEKTHQFLITQEEIEKILGEEEKIFEASSSKEKELETMASRLFKLKNLKAHNVMHPLREYHLYATSTTVQELRYSIKSREKWVIVQGKDEGSIVGVVFLRALLRAPEGKKVRDYLIKPWFITEEAPISALIPSFRRNSENIAFIVNSQGKTIGLLTLDHILEHLYGKPLGKPSVKLAVDVTVGGDISLPDFDAQFQTHLTPSGFDTLSHYLHAQFHELPQAGDSLRLPPYELIVKECSMTDILKVRVRTQSGPL
jgi:putative hemolysin